MPHPIPDVALDADIAILGKKGRGKTYCAKGVVERLLDLGRRVIVLDPLSTWWGLKLKPNGKPAYPIAVIGGPHGDLELDDGMGRGLGRFLAEDDNVSCVIDLGNMRKAEQARVVADLLEELFARNRRALTLVLEEADAFAPQQPMGDGNTRVLGEVDRIARRGRAFGFRLISITQRAAKLHKDVLTQLSTLVALGVTSPQDRDAIKAWVEGNADREEAKAVMQSLAALAVGEGWIWAPDLDILQRVRFPKIKTLDTSATPAAGSAILDIKPRQLPEPDLARIEAALKQHKDDAGAPGTTTRGTKSRPTGDVAGAEQRARAAGYKEGYARGLAESAAQARAAVSELTERVQAALGQTPAPAPVAIKPAAGAKTAPPSPGPAPKVTAVGPERKSLAILAQAYPAGLIEAQWATLTGLKRTGGTWSTYKSRLRVAGLIEQRGSLWFATAAGMDACGNVIPAPTTPDERIAMWCKAVGAAGRLLRILAEHYPDDMSRAQLAAAADLEPTAGTFSTYLSRLRSNELVIKRGDRVKAADALFIEV